METLQSAINAMRKDCFFGSLDLSEAFYSVPIRESDRKFFRFWHKNQKYQFTALIMGLTHSPRVFTKLLRPVFAKLQLKGLVSSAYIDDSCLQGSTYETCLQNIKDTVTLMDSLGLTVHPEKSVLVPTQQIIFLGFLLCSITMTIRLTPDRCQAVIECCKGVKQLSNVAKVSSSYRMLQRCQAVIECCKGVKQLSNVAKVSSSYRMLQRCQAVIECCKDIMAQKRVTIRQFSQLIGRLVATQPGVEYAPLYYKPVEKIQDHELEIHQENYNSFKNIPRSIHPIIDW